MKGKNQIYTGTGIEVHYDASRCIHAAECVHGLPGVFDPKARPWINPDGATPGEIAEVVDHCPTGALSCRRLDGGSDPHPKTENQVTVAADGPLYLRGRISDIDANGNTVVEDTRVALCRCGASKRKPLCDGSHTAAGFDDPGAIVSPSSEASDEAGTEGGLTVSCSADGPLGVQGAHTLVDGFAETVCRSQSSYLCRCGASANKPFCDGSHKRVGFKSDD